MEKNNVLVTADETGKSYINEDKYWRWPNQENQTCEGKSIGKWLVFVEKDRIDELFDVAKKKFLDFDLKGVLNFKASTQRKNPNATDENTKVIVFYVEDLNEVHVKNTGGILIHILHLYRFNCKSICFKTNEATQNNKYAVFGHTGISKYQLNVPQPDSEFKWLEDISEKGGRNCFYVSYTTDVVEQKYTRAKKLFRENKFPNVTDIKAYVCKSNRRKRSCLLFFVQKNQLEAVNNIKILMDVRVELGTSTQNTAFEPFIYYITRSRLIDTSLAFDIRSDYSHPGCKPFHIKQEFSLQINNAPYEINACMRLITGITPDKVKEDWQKLDFRKNIGYFDVETDGFDNITTAIIYTKTTIRFFVHGINLVLLPFALDELDAIVTYSSFDERMVTKSFGRCFHANIIIDLEKIYNKFGMCGAREKGLKGLEAAYLPLRQLSTQMSGEDAPSKWKSYKRSKIEERKVEYLRTLLAYNYEDARRLEPLTKIMVGSLNGGSDLCPMTKETIAFNPLEDNPFEKDLDDIFELIKQSTRDLEEKLRTYGNSIAKLTDRDLHRQPHLFVGYNSRMKKYFENIYFYKDDGYELLDWEHVGGEKRGYCYGFFKGKIVTDDKLTHNLKLNGKVLLLKGVHLGSYLQFEVCQGCLNVLYDPLQHVEGTHELDGKAIQQVGLTLGVKIGTVRDKATSDKIIQLLECQLAYKVCVMSRGIQEQDIAVAIYAEKGQNEKMLNFGLSKMGCTPSTCWSRAHKEELLKSIANHCGPNGINWANVKFPANYNKAQSQDQYYTLKKKKFLGFESFVKPGFFRKLKKRKFWSQSEDNALKKGVEIYGVGNWVQIKSDSTVGAKLATRTRRALCDRWRVLKKQKLRFQQLLTQK